MTALLIAFLCGPALIRQLGKRQGRGQPIREDGPPTHLLSKKGTPTMGGLMILLCLLGATLLWCDLTDPYVWIILFVTLGFGAIGFCDDFLKIRRISHEGLRGRTRLLGETMIACVAAVALVTLSPPELANATTLPFLKEVLLNLGFFFIPFTVFVIVGSGNAVNLTDGLDGLAIVPVMIACASFALIAYVSGNKIFAHYLQIHYVAGAGELTVLCAAVVGAGLGFLWFNAPPAAIFMGDTGSLALGGLIGTVAVATKHELILAVIGGIFVVEALSVIGQVASFKLTGRRIFKMAPIHHHFEQMGWTEAQVVIRFWIIAFVLALIGLSSLKLR